MVVSAVEVKYIKVEILLIDNENYGFVRNHVKLRGFSKDTLLFGEFWLWAWRISWGLQTCIAERAKVPNG